MRIMLMTTVLLAGCAAGSRPSADQVALTQARPAGAPVDCVQLRNIRSTAVRDTQTIDFILQGGNVLRNRLPNSCSGLGFERAFSYNTSVPQLCSVDTITVIVAAGPGARPTRGATCALGPFQPVTLPPG